jgi:hypothetical protein
MFFSPFSWISGLNEIKCSGKIETVVLLVIMIREKYGISGEVICTCFTSILPFISKFSVE